MSTVPESADPSAPKKVDPIDDFTENLQLFWFKHQNTIYTLITIVLLIIAGKGAWQWNQERVERNTGAAYAAAGDSVSLLQDFVVKHEGHVLSGAALLRIGDEQYSKGDFAAAAQTYAKAVAVLQGTPFSSRALLGQAVASCQAGLGAEGEQLLRQLSDDATLFRGIRAEASYHLATLLVEAGKTEQARQSCERILELDAAGFWGQRAMELRASLHDAGSASETKPSLSVTLPNS